MIALDVHEVGVGSECVMPLSQPSGAGGARTRRNLGVVHQVDTQQVAPEYRADVSVDRIRMKGYRFGTDDILIGYDDPTDVVLCC